MMCPVWEIRGLRVKQFVDFVDLGNLIYLIDNLQCHCVEQCVMIA